MHWAETGRPIQEFWDLTFSEIDICIRANANNFERTWNRTSWTVWRLAYLMRLKRLPRKPDQLFKKTGPARDWQSDKKLVEMFNSLVGGSDGRMKDE